MNKRIRNGLLGATLVAGGLFTAGSVNAQVDDTPVTTDTEQPADAPADAPADGEAGERGHRGHRGHRGDRGARGEATAELLGIEVDDLRIALQDGQTLADVATANGIDPQTVIDAKIASKTERIDAAIESGRLTQEEADEKLAGLEERVTTRVNEGRPERGDRAAADAADGAVDDG